MVMRRSFALGAASLLMLSGCAFMPSTGPHASLILDKKTNSIPVIETTPALAFQLWQNAAREESNRLHTTLASLGNARVESLKIVPGDTLELSLWVQNGQSDSVIGSVPQSRDMGHYTVDRSGAVDLPYVGRVSLRNMSLRNAEQKIATQYQRTQLFPQAEASLKISENKAQNIAIMGAVNTPTMLNWSEGGIDVNEAIAKAGGFKVFDPSKQGSDLSVNNVNIIRDGQSYSLPMKEALSRAVPLQAGDRLVLQHTPTVRALCLGAGWKTPTTVSFDETPALADVLAGAGDMNPGTAQGRAIFVFKHDQNTIYRINFDTTEGMKAAQKFPVNNQDIVYIPSARSVTLQQAVNIIMSIGYPAAMGAAIK